MLPTGYTVEGHLGAGVDGTAYAARVADTQQLVEVRVLNGARDQIDRWPLVTRRLRQVQLLQHSGQQAIQHLRLDDEPPIVVMNFTTSKPIHDYLAGALPLGPTDTVRIGRDLTSVLAAAHRLGIAHGALSPYTVRVTAERMVLLDLTALDVASAVGLSRTAIFPLAPEGPSGLPADVFAIGVLLAWLLTGQPPPADGTVASRFLAQSSSTVAMTPAELQAAQALEELVSALVRPDPDERPTAAEVLIRFEKLLQQVRQPTPGDLALTNISLIDIPDDGQPLVLPSQVIVPEVLGRFQVLRKLGQGGMGAVYLGKDRSDESAVAIKVITSDLKKNPKALHRFRKEARLLGEVRNPYVANLLEMNEQDGLHYLVMEFIDGPSVKAKLEETSKFAEADALAVIADVARALVEAHEQGIVHRDIKPENILIDRGPTGGRASYRLTDFGLARHVQQTESLELTQGNAVGTPLYMAPEQGMGNLPVDPRADVYSLGCTLFHLLTGRPPFQGDGPLAVLLMHANDPIPAVRPLAPQVSDAVVSLVEKMLAKHPSDRHADAAELLRDVEQLRRGAPTNVTVHPRLPASDPSRVMTFEFKWELEADARQLWPYVSNTERLNRAIGLPAVRFTETQEPGKGLRRLGEFRKAGVISGWEEHPFEWVEGRRLGVLREFYRGPLKWLASTVEMTPRAGGGTLLTHRIRVEPRSLFGRLVAYLEVGFNARSGLGRVYRRIDETVTGKLGAVADPFEPAERLGGLRLRRLERRLGAVAARGIDPDVLDALGEFLRQAPAQEVARIRPLALAKRLRVDAEQLVNACLHAAREGLLVLLWDILCPKCRVAAQVKDTLKAVQEHGQCGVCNLDFDLDFANSVEMIFQAHPEIRTTELRTYCIGGPGHAPHVAAQLRVAAGERVEMNLNLAEGAYRFRGPQLPHHVDFSVAAGAVGKRWHLDLTQPPPVNLPRAFGTAGQVLELTNPGSTELVVRVERMVARTDALTAARAATIALFRELFPGEVLSAGHLLSVATVTLVVTDVVEGGRVPDDADDAPAFARLHAHFLRTDELVRKGGGAVVKTVQAGLLATFPDPLAALQVALQLPTALRMDTATGAVPVRVGVHRGPALAATLNGHLDYFGSTVNWATTLPGWGSPDEIVLSSAVAGDPQVAALLVERGCAVQTTQVQGQIIHRIAPQG